MVHWQWKMQVLKDCKLEFQKQLCPKVKQQLQHHSEESQGHIERLNQLITSLGGQPYLGKMGLPLPGYPQDILQMMAIP